MRQGAVVFDGILSLPGRAREISYYGFEYFQMFHSIGLVFLGNRRFLICFLDAQDSERTSCGASPARDLKAEPVFFPIGAALVVLAGFDRGKNQANGFLKRYRDLCDRNLTIQAKPSKNAARRLFFYRSK